MGLVSTEAHERGIVRLVMNHADARNALGEDLAARFSKPSKPCSGNPGSV